MEELFRFHALRAAELPASVAVVSLDTGSSYQSSLGALQGHDRSAQARQLSLSFLDTNRAHLASWLDSKHRGALDQLLAAARALRDTTPAPSDASIDKQLRARVHDLFGATPDQVIASTATERKLVFDGLLALRIANLPATSIARSVSTNPQLLASTLVNSARVFALLLDLHDPMTRDKMVAALQAKLVSDYVGLAGIALLPPPPLPTPQAQLATALQTQADLTRFIVQLEALCPAGLEETGAFPNRAPTPVINDAVRAPLESAFSNLPQAIADVLGEGTVGPLSLQGFWYDHALAYEAKALQVQRVIDSLQKQVQQAPTPPVPTDPPTPTVAGYLRVGGVSEVKVVRHHIIGYTGAELAHIENVLQGETRNRTFRTLDRSETTTSTETETSTEEEKEVKTEDSFSLQSSVDQTLKESLDLKVGFDLKAQLGTVDIGLNTSFAFARSKEETKKEATNFAKDVTNRAAKKVSQLVRAAQQTKVLHETEETVEHGFDGTQAAGNVTGLYQWIEKIHRVQIFTLGSGARAIIDGIVLQPGQRLLGTPVAGSGGAVTIASPPALDISPADIFPWNYLSLAAKYGASAVPSPPPLITTASVSAANPQRTDQYADNTSTFAQDIALPDGTAAAWAHATLTCELNGDWDKENAIAAIGPRTWSVNGTDSSFNQDNSLVVMDKDKIVRQLRVRELKMLNGERGIVPCTVYGSHVQGISFVGLVSCVRTAEALQNWQLSVFNALRAANAQANQDYQEAVSRATLAQAYNVGPAPGLVQDVIRDEIKRCAIAILANSASPEDFYKSLDNYYETGQTSEVAKRVLFFEHALEWENMTYVLYPYFWADNRFDGWNQHMNRQEKDDELVAFLKAGAARVVVPVRPIPAAAGEDADFSAYLRAESLPSLDELIDVNSPLSLAIDAEIKAANGQDVEIFDDEWNINIPTELVTLQTGTTFPTWTENKKYVDGVRVQGEFVEDKGSSGGAG